MAKTLGRLLRALRPGGSHRIVTDAFSFLSIHRDGHMVVELNARVASAGRALQMRLSSQVGGDSSTQFRVAFAPALTDVLQGDDAWIEDQRFYVVMVDSLPHEVQIILQRVQ